VTTTNDAHARPSGDAPELLYDVNVPTPTHAERARTLVAQMTTGTLCTLAGEPAGYPYGSFVTVAFDDGAVQAVLAGQGDDIGQIVFALGIVVADPVQQPPKMLGVDGHDAGIA